MIINGEQLKSTRSFFQVRVLVWTVSLNFQFASHEGINLFQVSKDSHSISIPYFYNIRYLFHWVIVRTVFQPCTGTTNTTDNKNNNNNNNNNSSNKMKDKKCADEAQESPAYLRFC